MNCQICKSENILLFKEGKYVNGSFCNQCGNGSIDNYGTSCCGNPNLTDIRFEQSNGTIVQRVACKNCYELIGGAKKKTDEFQSLRLYTQKSYIQFTQDKLASRSKMHAFLVKLSQELREQRSIEWWNNYDKYLKTDNWKSKRLLVLQRENNLCQGCRNSTAVHVHHLTYDNLGDELLFQLVALCKICHLRVHPNKSF